MLTMFAAAVLTQVVPAPGNGATVMFYRTGGITGLLRGCPVREKGREVARLRPRSAVKLSVAAGRHVYMLRDGSSAVSLDVAQGEIAYVRCKMIGLVARPALLISDQSEFDALSAAPDGDGPRPE